MDFLLNLSVGQRFLLIQRVFFCFFEVLIEKRQMAAWIVVAEDGVVGVD